MRVEKNGFTLLELLVALVVFASWRPGKALVGALLFAFFDAYQLRLQTAIEGVPYQLFLMAPYVLSIAALILSNELTVHREVWLASFLPYLTDSTTSNLRRAHHFGFCASRVSFVARRSCAWWLRALFAQHWTAAQPPTRQRLNMAKCMLNTAQTKAKYKLNTGQI